MSETVAENFIETGSIPVGNVSIENAIADMGKAATLAEWVYAGLRIETRDWSAELRKSSEVQLPKFALLDSGVDHTGSVFSEVSDQKTAPVKSIGSSVGVSGQADATLDQMLSGLRDAKVMGQDGFRPSVVTDNQIASRVMIETSVSFASASTETILISPIISVESPVNDVVTEPVVQSIATIVIPVATPVVEDVVEPVVQDVVAPVEAMFDVTPVASPVVEDIVELVVQDVVVETTAQETVAPVIPQIPDGVGVVVAAVQDIGFSVELTGPAVAEAKSDLNFGRLYFHDFDSNSAKIVIQSDYFLNFDDLVAKANLYQDEASTVFELDSGADLIILTQFDLGNISAEMFVFEPANLESETAQVFIREFEIKNVEPPVGGDVFNFGLGSGRIYVTDFEITSDQIFIKADLFSSFDEMMSRVALYQDETSAIFELHNGADMIIMPHFSISDVKASMFVFEAETLQSDTNVSAIQYGSDLDDTLIFGAGDQLIDPSQGFDIVTGGEGNDTFIFGAMSGHDFIVDFKAGEDSIQIDSDLAMDFADLMDRASIYQDGGATQIEFNSGQMVTLYGSNAKLASADWFSFS